SQLPKKAQDHAEFQAACINAFFSFSIELRSGSVKVQDIKTLHSAYSTHYISEAVNKMTEGAPNPLVEIYEIHFGSSLERIVPNEESLYFFVEYGSMPEALVSEATDSCQYVIQQRPPTGGNRV